MVHQQYIIDKNNADSPSFVVQPSTSTGRAPMMELPADPWINYHFFGMSFSICYPLQAIFLHSFNFGYLDTASYIRLGCFSCMQTGNLSILAGYAFLPVWQQSRSGGGLLNKLPTNEFITYILVQIFVSTFLGAWLVTGLNVHFLNRKKTLAVLLVLLGVSTVVTDAVLNNHLAKGVAVGDQVEWVALFMSLSLGALSFWSSELGRTLWVQTVNLQKLGLALGKFGCCYEQSSEKERGSNIGFCVTIVGYIAGCFVATFVLSSSAYQMCFGFFAYSLPVQILLSDCWHELAEILRYVVVSPFSRKTAPIPSGNVPQPSVSMSVPRKAQPRDTLNPIL